MKSCPLLFLFLFSIALHGQKFTISGYIQDGETGESLIGATIVDLKTSYGSSANTHGFYSLTLNHDSTTFVYSYVGYKRKSINLFLTQDTTINIGLEGALLEEVVISATQADAVHETTKMSAFTISMEQIKALPVLLGETDILKALQLMPGVQSGNEGSTGLYVRGGGPDQNLILLDGVPVYNASHLFGFFSVFNADAINQVELTKGGFPARYGGRLSSVIDINMKEGNMKEFKGEGSVGLISSKLTLEGPITKNKTSFIVSARRTYIDVLSRPILKKQIGETGYYFYDLNIKVNHVLDPNNHIYLSSYIGNDKAYAREKASYSDGDITFNSKDEFGLKWGNVIMAFRWNHIFGPKLFSNVTGTYSRYGFGISQKYEEEKSSTGSPFERLAYGNEYISGIHDWSAKIDFDYFPNPNHYIRFGFNNILHKFSPGVFSYRSTKAEENTTAGAKTTRAYELAFYFEDDWEINEYIKINAGIHSSAFAVENLWYYSVQPRISGRYLFAEDFSFKASFSNMTQYIHLLSNVGVGLPTDLWVSSTARVKPQEADQLAIGLAKTYKLQYELSVEGYYKKMRNLIEYKDGATYLNIEGDWQDKIATSGKGKSYGMEALLQKKTGTITGWIGYSLSKTYRQFETLNFGNEFPYKYDRRHDINLAMTHKLDRGKDFSLVWVYGTGNAITLPSAVYEASSNSFDTRYNNSSKVFYYGDRNSYRMKSYHCLDLSFSWLKTKNWGQRKWTVGLYNVYNRLNPFFIDLGMDDENNMTFIEYTLFPVMPSVSYSFKF